MFKKVLLLTMAIRFVVSASEGDALEQTVRNFEGRFTAMVVEVAADLRETLERERSALRAQKKEAATRITTLTAKNAALEEAVRAATTREEAMKAHLAEMETRLAELQR